MWKVIKILRDPDGGNGGGAASAGGDGGAAATTAKVVVEGDVSKGISNWNEVFPALVPQEYRTVKDKTDPNKMVPNPIFDKYKSPADLMKGIAEMNDMIGKKGVIVPGPQAKPEEMAAFYTAIGRPENPDGYKFTNVEGLHKAVTVTPDALKGWAQVAHSIGLRPDQADALNQWWLKTNDAAVRQLEADSLKAAQDAETALRSAWKEKFDANKAAAHKAMEYFFGKDFIKENPNFVNNPKNINGFFNVGSKITMDGDGFPSLPSGKVGDAGAGGQYGSYGNLEAAKARLTEINSAGSDANKILMDQKHKDHESIIEERKKLYEMVYPG